MSTVKWTDGGMRFQRETADQRPIEPLEPLSEKPDVRESDVRESMEHEHEPRHWSYRFLASRGLLLLAALFVGFFVTVAIFLALPAPGGISRFDLRKRYQAWHASRDRDSGKFQIFGPVRVTPGSVAFSWISPGDSLFDAYEVHYSTHPNFTPSKATLFHDPIREAAANGAEVTGLDCSTTYYFRIRMKEKNGGFQDSPEVAARTDGCPDTTNYVYMAVNPYTYGDSTDPWTDPWDDPLYGGSYEDSSFTARYEAEYGLNEAEGGSLAIDRSQLPEGNTPESTSYDPAPLKTRVPVAPVHLYTPSGSTSRSADVAWSADTSDDFDAYEVHIGRSPGFRPSPLTLHVPPIRNAARTEMTAERLNCNSVYFVIVRTRYTDGSYGDSNEERITTARCDDDRASPTSQGP
jgi:hypothetical protein